MKQGHEFHFECSHCGADNTAAPDEHGTRVELIRWVREPNPRLRWTLRLWCGSCPEPTCWWVCDQAAFLWRNLSDIYIHDMQGLTGDCLLGLLEVEP